MCVCPAACTPMFITVVSLTAKRWKQHKCPPDSEWRSSNTAQPVKVIVINANNLGSVSGTHMVERINSLRLSSSLHTCAMENVCTKYPTYIPVAVVKHWPKATCRERGVFQFISSSPLQMEASSRAQGRKKKKCQRGMLITGLIPMSWPACFLITTK